MEMVLVFPFCVPAAAGIVCVFMGNPENIFLNALSWATAYNASAPAAMAPLWSDNSREGNTTQSQSAGAVRGDRHCPLRKLVLYHLFENSGFLQNRFLKAAFFLFFFVAGKQQNRVSGRQRNL